MSVEKILIVDDNLLNLKVLSTSISKMGYETLTASRGIDVVENIDKLAPDLIVLDINMPEMDGFEVCRHLRNQPQTATIPIIMLTANNTLDDKIRGFEVGADDYVTKPYEPEYLNARIKVLLRRSISVAESGASLSTATSKVIAVFSLRGGVGVSSFSANLAAGLAQIWEKPVAFIDMVMTLGQSALLFNMPLKRTWVDLARIPNDELKIGNIRDVMLNHQSGVSIIAAPRDADEYNLIRSELVKKTFDVIGARFDYILLDMPHDFGDIALEGLRFADEIILMVTPELASVRAAVGALDVFKKMGFDKKTIRVVLNRVFDKRGFANKDIEGVLKRRIDLVIPNATEVFVPAINLGEPAVLNAASNPVGALLEEYAYLFSKNDHQEMTPKEPSGGWLRVKARQRERSRGQQQKLS